MSSQTWILKTECAAREDIASSQAHRLEELLGEIYGRNQFYTRKLDQAGISISSLNLPFDLPKLPLTSKAELAEDQGVHPPWGTAISDPIERYTRYSQTSSTTGPPLRWLDTNESWQWVLECWKAVYRAARVGPGDRIFFPFSFGPFLGFWAAFEAGCQIGAQCVSGGGMTSQLRLRMIETINATVICCTPTYALWLAEVALERTGGSDRLRDNSVRTLIVAGEPGGSIPATRDRIQRLWDARVIDHHGLTEVGPVSFECWEHPGTLHVNELEFLSEVLDSETCRAVPDGQKGELVITNLGRRASPVIRYRTGDIVIKRSDPCVCGRTLVRFEGGILGRADDMISVRGVNVYPAAIESVIRSCPEILEFRSTASNTRSMRRLSIEIELAANVADASEVAARLAGELRESLGLSVPVQVVEPGTLPRFEMKARRFIVES